MVSGENENTVFKSIPINADTAKASFDSVFLGFFIVISHHYVSFSCRRQFYNNFRALRWKQFPHKLNWI